MSELKGRHFRGEVVLCAAHWYGEGVETVVEGRYARSVPVGQQAELACAPDRIAARARHQPDEQAADTAAHPVRGRPEPGRDDLAGAACGSLAIIALHRWIFPARGTPSDRYVRHNPCAHASASPIASAR